MTRSLLHLFGIHYWKYTGSTRKCQICGLYQVDAQVFNADTTHSWLEMIEYYPNPRDKENPYNVLDDPCNILGEKGE